MNIPITDDSNIEFNNIFPTILSKNKQANCFLNLTKMTERPKFYKDLGDSPSAIYHLNYSLI